MWTLNADCARLVRESWNVNFYDCPMYILDQNLKLLKSRMKVWNEIIFGNVHSKTFLVEIFLKAVQKEIEGHGYIDNLQEKEIKSQHDLELDLNMEEEFEG